MCYVRNSSGVAAEKGNLEGKINAAQKNIDGGYQMELAIPWKAINGKPCDGKFIGIDIHVMDNDNNGRSEKLIWSGKQDFARRSPMSFGTMKLAEEKPVLNMNLKK